MGLLSLMRAFSIRMRMIGAIGVVLTLLLLVGGSGLWGMLRLQSFNQDFVAHSNTESVALRKLEVNLGEMRRDERDMLIHFQTPDRLRDAKTRWTQAEQGVRQALQSLQAGEPDEDNALAQEVGHQLDAYVSAAGPVVAQLEQAAFESPAMADASLQGAHSAFDAIQTTVGKLSQVLDNEIGVTQSAAAEASTQVWWLFLVALGVATLVVVPTTLANMVSITRPLQQAQGLVVSIARGDLTTQPDLNGSDELSELMRCLVDMQSSLTRTVGEVRGAADGIRLASADIATGSMELSSRTEQAASSLEQTAASMDQITQTVRQSVDAARSASGMAHDNAVAAQRGGELVGQVVSTMDAINQSSKKIHDIIGVIDGIAFQTNILALNAAVEAARAGEAGRGFAVVAGEVRSLAQRSADAAHEIKGLISASVDTVAGGTQLVHQAGGAIRDIVDIAQKVSAFIGEITAASSDQSQSLAEINSAVGQMDQMTQENAALVEQSTSAAERMRQQAQRLSELVAVFRLGGDAATGHPPLMPAATRGHGEAGAYKGVERRREPRA